MSFLVSKDNEKYLWCDIAKAIGIFLMVCGHTSIPSSISNWIYSFHMPLFFVLSGFFFSREKSIDIRIYAKHKFCRLMIPYFVYSVIAFVGMYLVGCPDKSALLVGWKGYALWFIPVLFFTEIIFTLLLRINYIYVAVFLMGGIGYVFYKNAIFLPYKFEVVFSSISFFYLGFVSKSFLKKVDVNWVVMIGLFLVSFVLSQYLHRMDMCNNLYGWNVLNIFNAGVGCLAVFILSKKIEIVGNNGFIVHLLSKCGQNTIVVVGLSQLVNLVLKSLFSIMPIQYEMSFLIRFCFLWCILAIVVKIKGIFSLDKIL